MQNLQQQANLPADPLNVPLPCQAGPGGLVLQSDNVANTADSMGRRDSPRVAYAHLEWVAPWSEGGMPPRDKFQEVCCRDISTSGFSYFANVVPKSKNIVVALGSQSLVKGVVAEVIHVLPVEHDGEKMYAIGCKYTSRVVY